jgi:hypothetical protein
MKPLPLIAQRQSKLKLRGHTLLCLQGFRGLGYNRPFVENLARIHKSLAEDGDLMIEVVDTPDAICSLCPHHADAAGCTLNGPRGEVMIQTQDREVLTRLGLKSGERVQWRVILDRIRTSIREDDLTTICGQCRWLSLGYCRSGIARLRERP